MFSLYLDTVKKVLVDQCDVEIWAAVVVVVIHLIMAVEAVAAVVVVEVEAEEIEAVHRGLHGIKLHMNPVIY
jgi:hypothetical protein